LWAELTAAGREDGTIPDNLTVNDIMDTWTLQMGFPVVTAVRDYAEGTVELSQHKFLISPTAAVSSNNCNIRQQGDLKVNKGGFF
jgi:aminopeptidase N